MLIILLIAGGYIWLGGALWCFAATDGGDYQGFGLLFAIFYALFAWPITFVSTAFHKILGDKENG